MTANTTTKTTEHQILKMKRKAYLIAKMLLAKHNQRHRKNELGNFESYNAQTHEVKRFKIKIEHSTRCRKSFDRGVSLLVSVTVGYKKERHALLDALNSKYDDTAIFSIRERGGVSLWNAANKNGKPSKSIPKGIRNVLYHEKL